MTKVEGMSKSEGRNRRPHNSEHLDIRADLSRCQASTPGVFRRPRHSDVLRTGTVRGPILQHRPSEKQRPEHHQRGGCTSNRRFGTGPTLISLSAIRVSQFTIVTLLAPAFAE